MNQVESIAQLAALTLEQLTAAMGSSGHAEQLYAFMHTDCNQSASSTNESTEGTGGGARKQPGAAAVRPRNKRLPLKKLVVKKS